MFRINFLNQEVFFSLMQTIIDPRKLDISMEEMIDESTLMGQFFGIGGTFPHTVGRTEDIPEAIKELARTIETTVIETYKDRDDKFTAVEVIPDDLKTQKKYGKYEVFIAVGTGLDIPALVYLGLSNIHSTRKQKLPLRVVAQVRLLGDYQEKGRSLLIKLNELGAKMDISNSDYHIMGKVASNGYAAVAAANMLDIYKHP